VRAAQLSWIYTPRVLICNVGNRRVERRHHHAAATADDEKGWREQDELHRNGLAEGENAGDPRPGEGEADEGEQDDGLPADSALVSTCFVHALRITYVVMQSNVLVCESSVRESHEQPFTDTCQSNRLNDEPSWAETTHRRWPQSCRASHQDTPAWTALAQPCTVSRQWHHRWPLHARRCRSTACRCYPRGAASAARWRASHSQRRKTP